MLINYRSVTCQILIWTILSAPPIAAAGDWVTGDIDQPVSESGMGPAAPYFIQPFNAQPQRFDHGDPSPYEQYMLELINRARANPGAEAARLAIDLNQGLAPGTISDTPKPPLAFHPLLVGAARAHSQWMLDTGNFSHTGAGGSSPGDRMEQAGYPFSGSWTWGENITWTGTTGTPDLTEFTASMHDGLFLSSGHRRNLMNPAFDEAGIGLLEGRFQGYNALMGTQKFARSGGTPGPLLTGVVYDDRNGNRFYDVGEGVAGVTVHLTDGAYYTVTSDSGGFALPYGNSAGEFDLVFSGDPLPAPFRITVVGTGQNMKQDLIVTDQPPPAYSLTVAKAGTGSGTVISNPSGIDCGVACAAEFAAGASVALTASAASGSTLAGWSGCDSTSGASCMIAMTANRTVTATFATQDYALTVNSAGANGVAINSPTSAMYAGITNYTVPGIAENTMITLTAPASAEGVNFTNWSGCNSTLGTSCTVLMTANKTVTVNYTPTTPTLTVNSSGATGVAITADPATYGGVTNYSHAGIAAGASLTLTAPASAGAATFGNWSGCASTANRNCTVVMTQNRTVTVNYTSSTCLYDEHRVLQNATVTGTALYGACRTLVAGPAFTISPTGDATFRAGQRITLRPGFRVQAGGRFRAQIDPSLRP